LAIRPDAPNLNDEPLAYVRTMTDDTQNTPAGSDFGSWMKVVWQVVAGIPRGHVLTYGEVARLAGMSRWARRVSRAMRRAPKSLELPWHRVVNAQGRISFPEDSNGYRLQRERLEAEGVVFDGGRIDLDRYGYRGALDHLLWSEPL
jgi:methylated-DNA-protein-cysteine methyltransferase-like protein